MQLSFKNIDTQHVMSHDIKQQRPRRGGRFHQGYIDPRTCRKYYTQHERAIIYRSSWERDFILFLERASQVVRWGSESLGIEYTMPDGTTHTYYPDFIVELRDGTSWIVEVKPEHETRRPLNEGNEYAMRTYIRNVSKWRAARQFAIEHNARFIIVTERFLDTMRRV